MLNKKHSSLVNSTLVYMTSSILRYIFVRPNFFGSKLLLLYDFDTR